MTTPNAKLTCTVNNRPYELPPGRHLIGNGRRCAIQLPCDGVDAIEVWAELRFVAGWQLRVRNPAISAIVDGVSVSGSRFIALTNATRVRLSIGPSFADIVLGVAPSRRPRNGDGIDSPTDPQPLRTEPPGYRPPDYPPRASAASGSPSDPGGSMAGWSAPSSSRPPVLLDVDIDNLRHPTESSRFAIACAASLTVVLIAVASMLSTGSAADLSLIVLGVGLAILLSRLLLTLWRIRLLGDAVHVSPATLPHVHEVVDEVREKLRYENHIEVFVADKISRVLGDEGTSIKLNSYFGHHVIVIEGEAIGDLSDARERRQFVFLVATVIGALKARHTTWTPALHAMDLTGVTKLVWPFVYPWFRATVYTGDRIAFACCGDLDTSLQVVCRALVGPEVAPDMRIGGFVQQALTARRNVFLRLSQLVRPAPHVTNRYLELLSFASTRDPSAFDTFRAKLGSEGDGLARVAARW